jgi:hypothetical protein
MRSPIFLLSLVVSIPTALAQERPLLFPIRDAIVDTKVTVGNGLSTSLSQVAYSAAELKSRTTFSNFANFYVITDYKAKVVISVYTDSDPPTYLFMPSPDDEKVEYKKTRLAENVAGLGCQVWQALPMTIPNPAAAMPGQPRTYVQKITVCTTADGLLLRQIVDMNSAGNPRVITEAVRVQFLPQDKSLFRLPVGAVRK